MIDIRKVIIRNLHICKSDEEFVVQMMTVLKWDDDNLVLYADLPKSKTKETLAKWGLKDKVQNLNVHINLKSDGECEILPESLFFENPSDSKTVADEVKKLFIWK